MENRREENHHRAIYFLRVKWLTLCHTLCSAFPYDAKTFFTYYVKCNVYQISRFQSRAQLNGKTKEEGEKKLLRPCFLISAILISNANTHTLHSIAHYYTLNIKPFVPIFLVYFRNNVFSVRLLAHACMSKQT